MRQSKSCLLPRSLFLPGVLLIMACAIILRFTYLDKSPLHADEATGAFILGERLQGEIYRFNPAHFHGPTLSLFTMPLAALRGEKEWSELKEVTLRLVPALFSTLTVLLPLFLIRYMGAIPCLASSLFLATSPLLVYYGRLYIHETLLGFFTAAALIALLAYVRKPGAKWAILAGTAVGLMAGTKETAAITVLAWIGSAALLAVEQRFMVKAWGTAGYGLLSRQQVIRDAVLFAGFAGGSIVLFYTDFFRYPQGFANFLTTFFVYELSGGHEKGFWQYAYWMLLPKAQLGSIWTEGSLFLWAAIGSVACFMASKKIMGRFLCYSLIIHGLIYFGIGYKVPWLMVVPWIHLCLLAGIGVGSLWKTRPAWRFPVVVLLGGTLFFQTLQAYRAAITFPSDARNPYAYVPTAPDVTRMRLWLDELIALQKGEIKEDPLVAVIGEQYWPLPWYLRDLPHVGFWESLPMPAKDLPLVLVTHSHADQGENRLGETHRAFPYGLRHEYLVFLYVREDLWQLYHSETSLDHEQEE